MADEKKSTTVEPTWSIVMKFAQAMAVMYPDAIFDDAELLTYFEAFKFARDLTVLYPDDDEPTNP